MAHNWNDFNKFEDKLSKYLLPKGQGNTIATQASACINKLVYKWFNDGDVYDNTYNLKGWCNDLSSYANWLYWNIDGADVILRKIGLIFSEDEYTELLYELCEFMYNLDWDEMNKTVGKDSIYESDGEPFYFNEEEDDEEDYL